MARRILTLVVFMCLLLTVGMAESLVDNDYTDVPTAMTQDSVAELLAGENCTAETLQPDEESIALLDDVYRFVWEERNRPARYYDEETQRKIAELSGVDIDVLHMTEAMRLQLSGEPEHPVTVTMRLNVEYRVGQLVIVVLGIPQEDGEYLWFPYRGRVEVLGEIKWDIPVADWEQLRLQPISFHVLTDRIGPRGERLWHTETITEQVPVFSKDSHDVTTTVTWYTESGEPIEDDFRVWLVDLTEPMQAEVLRIGKHLAEGGAILDYFPAERRDEALLMLDEGADIASLIPYDIIALQDENYKDTYGDVNVEIVFSTAYRHDRAMVILAGFPIRDAAEAPWVEWYVLRAAALEEYDQRKGDHPVEIGLKQLNLPRMEEEPLMLVVISEAIEQEIP